MKNSLCILFLLFSSILWAQDKPNILIILSDDHAYQTISAYGSTMAVTPHIDRLAHEGAIFNNAFVTNSICGPSRATLLTGKYSHKHGYKDNSTSNFDHSQDLFAKRLQTAGYKTAWIGKLHLGDQPQGFDYFDILPGQGHYYNPDFIKTDGSRENVVGYVTDIITDKAEAWLDQLDKTQPFCLILGHKATHRTWLPDTTDLGAFDDQTFSLPANFFDNYHDREAAQLQRMSIDKDLIMGYDLKMLSDEEASNEPSINRLNEQQLTTLKAYYDPIHADLKARNLVGKELAEWKYQRYIKDYLSTAASLDRNVGRLLDYLGENDLADNTLVIYLSDQGFYMGEHGWFDKRFIYEESLRTPMVARFPGIIKPGTQIDEFIVNIDIAPTLLEVGVAPIPTAIQGISILPLLRGENQTIRDEVYYHYYEGGGGHNVAPHFGVRTQRYKLIRFYDDVQAWELYDLDRDPDEMQNLYGKQGFENITENLKQLLSEQVDRFDDDDARTILAQDTRI